MSEAPKKKQKGFGEESLEAQDERIMGKLPYMLTWFGGCVAIGTFMMGSSLVPPAGELNLFQAIVAMIIGSTVVAIGITLNGKAGHDHGIPFIVQARTTFGTKGTILPGFIRAVPAVIWFGIQSWVGAQALNSVAIRLFSFDNIVFFFIVFQLIQIAIAILGFRGIKWLETIGSVAILISLIFMFYMIYTNFSAEISERIVNIEGTWGLPFWGGTTAFLGVYTTLLMNASDYTRELEHETGGVASTTLQWLGIVPVTAFMGFIGLLASGATGTWDPIQLFVDVMPNNFALVVALLFIAMAQITTNVLNNVIPPTYAMMDAFDISFKKGVIITGLLAFVSFPWKIATADLFLLFIQIYSAFLGPVFAVMVVDYFFIRKRDLEMHVIYNKEGAYDGVNWAGMISVLVGAVAANLVVELSWYVSLVPAGLTYYLLMTNWSVCKSFLVGTDFELAPESEEEVLEAK